MNYKIVYGGVRVFRRPFIREQLSPHTPAFAAACGDVETMAAMDELLRSAVGQVALQAYGHAVLGR